MTVRKIPGFTSEARNNACSMCGSGPGKERKNDPISPNRLVLDLDVDIDFEGHFQICQDCGEEIGKAAGMISKAHSAKVREQAAHDRSHAIAAEAERDAARKALAAALDKTGELESV